MDDAHGMKTFESSYHVESPTLINGKEIKPWKDEVSRHQCFEDELTVRRSSEELDNILDLDFWLTTVTSTVPKS